MKKKKVILGLSGGVDSAVSAILLLKQGYDVEGVFMRNWDSFMNNDVLGNPNDFSDVCPQEKDYMDALECAKELGIKLHRIDFIDEYWHNVFEYFLDEYRHFRTPNPDILCNSEIKFKCFLEYANKIGCDYIAMGHYARVIHDGNKHHLLRGIDSNKDQSYFLCQLTQRQIEKALFPVGDYTKPEIRKIASDNNINVAHKKDSTGVCFIGERNFKLFLENYLLANPGNMETLDGKIMGRHDGIMYYTIGQRHGLKIGGDGEAWYVIGKDAQRNVLLVGQGSENEYLYSNRCLINRVNILEKDYLDRLNNGEAINLSVKFRYRQKDVSATIRRFDEEYLEVLYPIKSKAVTPGQECAIYDGDYVIGGGTIDQVFMNNDKRRY